jgi:hypothetical protein
VVTLHVEYIYGFCFEVRHMLASGGGRDGFENAGDEATNP